MKCIKLFLCINFFFWSYSMLILRYIRLSLFSFFIFCHTLWAMMDFLSFILYLHSTLFLYFFHILTTTKISWSTFLHTCKLWLKNFLSICFDGCLCDFSCHLIFVSWRNICGKTCFVTFFNSISSRNWWFLLNNWFRCFYL